MSVEEARSKFRIAQRLSNPRRHYPHDLAECGFCGWWNLHAEARALVLDNATAEAHRTDWRTVQQIRWQDALHRTLMAEVAW
jgi:hypothetical protein